VPNAKSLAKWLAVAALTPLPIKKIVAPLSRAVNSISTNDLISDKLILSIISLRIREIRFRKLLYIFSKNTIDLVHSASGFSIL